MKLDLARYYHALGTNGMLRVNDQLLCYTIELPWLNNKRNKSCIPDGRYRVEKRYSERFKMHMVITGVPDRSFILFHPANDAATELKGCIAPVSALTGHGKGIASKDAFLKLRKAVYTALDKNDEVWLTIHPMLLASGEAPKP